METIKKYKNILLALGAVLAIFLGGKDVNYWGLKEPTGEQILKKVEARKIDPETLMLTPKQESDIKKIIDENPSEYSELQQSLISTKTGKDILDEIETKKLDPRTVLLNARQLNEISKLITANPNNYTKQQHYFVREKTAEEILDLVGFGIKSPNLITLTPKQHQEIKALIEANPTQYNTAQKVLIPELNK